MHDRETKIQIQGGTEHERTKARQTDRQTDRQTGNLLGAVFRTAVTAALVLAASIFVPMEVQAATESVTYVDENGTEKTVEATVFEGNFPQNVGNGPYVVTKDVAVSDAVSLTKRYYSSPTLILKNGTLTFEKGITLGQGVTLTIYGTSGGMGKLHAIGTEDEAGIGFTTRVNIYGGTIIAEGGSGAPGIGKVSGISGTLTIGGGTVTATGGNGGAGIGGGSTASVLSAVNITGGTVTATGTGGAAGIGYGACNESDITSAPKITISGGSVTVTGGIGEGDGTTGVATSSSGSTTTSNEPVVDITGMKLTDNGSQVTGTESRYRALYHTNTLKLTPCTSHEAGEGEATLEHGVPCKYCDDEAGTKLSSATVTFDANGGTPTPQPVTITSAQAVSPATTPTRDGYKLSGWTLNNAAYDLSTKVVKNITLVAQWKAVWTVTFESDGGSTVAAQTVENNGKATEPSDPTKDGYTFAGWKKGGSDYDFNTAVTGNITLTASWTKNAPNTYTVTFNSNGGSTVAQQTIASGGKATKPANPTKASDSSYKYTFKEWQYNGSAYDFENTPVTANINLTAAWTQTAITQNTGTGTNTGTELPNTDSMDARGVYATVLILSALCAGGAFLVRRRSQRKG